MPDSRFQRVIFENIPRFLKQFLLWCVWIPTFENRGPTPLSAIHGGALRSDSLYPRRDDWCGFEDSAYSYGRGNYAGIGILLGPESGVVAITITIDGGIGAHGDLPAWVKSIVVGLPTYWEISPFQKVQGFVRGGFPPDCPTSVTVAGGKIEVQSQQHVSAVTGQRVAGSVEDVAECSALFEWFVGLFRTPSITTLTATPPMPSTDSLTAIQMATPQAPPPMGSSLITSGLWPEPERLDSDLVQVARFDLGLLPSLFQRYAVDVAERLQVPVDFMGATLLVSLGGVTGRRARIRPKRFDDWEEVGNLWGGIVADPGAKKSPAVKKGLKVLIQLEAEAAQQFQEAQAQYQREKDDRGTTHGQQLTVVDFGLSTSEQTPDEPVCVRFIVNDVTTPKLQVIHAENPAGFLYYRDELAGLLSFLDARGHESDRAFYLECWSGDEPFTVDRIIRGTIRASKKCLSVFGGIQPGVQRRYLLDAITSGKGDDGLAQRLQILVYPDKPETWVNIDREPDHEAEDAVTRAFRSIAAAPAEGFVAHFDSEAQAFFYQWLERLENRLLHEPMPTYLLSHLAKYRGLMPRISLLCHLADSGFVEEIPLQQARRAAAWCDYLESHARRVYSEGSPRSMASILSFKLKDGALGARFTLRELRKKGWSGFDNPSVVRAVLRELEEAGWIRREPQHPSERGGRPAEAYLVNPKVLVPKG